ncbi:ribosomal protection-like ABC-F family protein [Ostreibacterium oceani]|uniref:ATP-binding cassette domain-containing protein n=1 Tax=Ostreibacterium oceani TaxID=2654998 RepID=A0A6N7ETU0_9GAMM|nr:ABC-F family ATP-binding cassette domain-containing protein [Ostreibacterium oceani]MPV85971.1 ATP-binding cassette domain-containing protein [Ostreibacterium oceani]
MALVDLFEASKQYDTTPLLHQVDFHLHEGDRVAIIGKNGCGKSTLMKMVHGTLTLDHGKRVADTNIQIEMLSQIPRFDGQLTVREAIESELSELKAAQTRYQTLTAQLADDFTNEALKTAHEQTSNFLDHHNAWSLDNRVEQALVAFRLKHYENKPVQQLSGGEQRRVALAGLILKSPDVLILDEPTNHLDVQMVQFLEETILNGRYTILFVSHDRYFIDNIATQIVEIENQKLVYYKGGYRDFLASKEQRIATLEKQQHNLSRLYQNELSWLNRGVKARTKRNMGRVKRVNELKQQVNQNPNALKRMRSELMREKAHFSDSDKNHSKKIFFDVYNINYAIDGRPLIRQFKTKILAKQRIAIVGPNGAGKSTLLKLLTGKIQPDSGTIKRAEFNIGYFDQQREALDENKDLISTFCPGGGDRIEVQGKNMHVYGYLKLFNFPQEDLTKRIGMLSGGERSRVALALLFTKKVDCLIMDEPTNDLDIQTINILEEKLNAFDGVVIFVSHDRYFVDKIAQKLFIFNTDGSIEESYQKYSEYLDIEQTLKEIGEAESEIKHAKTSMENTDSRSKTTAQKLTFKDKHALDNLPHEIDQLVEKIAILNQSINENASDAEQLQALTTTLAECQQSLTDKEEQYLALLERAEALQS